MKESKELDEIVVKYVRDFSSIYMTADTDRERAVTDRECKEFIDGVCSDPAEYHKMYYRLTRGGEEVGL